VLLCAALARPAAAQAPADPAAEHFGRGVKLYDKGNFAAALAEFEAAYQVSGAWEVLLNVGLTQENLLRYNEAVAALERYLADGADRVPPDRRARVLGELEHIRGVVASVAVKVVGPPATVELDGRVVGRSPLAGPLLVAGGLHRLRVFREGASAAERTFEVAPLERREVELSPVPTPPRVTTATLTVLSRPPSAQLLVDGQPVGLAPWTRQLDEGAYDVSARLAGHQDQSMRVELRGGLAKTVTLDLSPLPAARRWWSRWYVWAGVGAVVAAGVTLGVYASRTTYDVNLDFPR
jgi:hypothetical protein